LAAQDTTVTGTGSLINPKTFKTLEFLLLVLSNVAGWLLVLVDYIPSSWGIYASALSGAGYALWRGFAKMNADTKDYWQTTEFWAAVVTSLPNVIGAFADTINSRTFGIVQSFIVMATGLAMGIRKQPDVAAGNVSALDVGEEADLFVEDTGVDPDSDGDDSLLAGQPHADPTAVTKPDPKKPK
jgi:hypothetical protein